MGREITTLRRITMVACWKHGLVSSVCLGWRHGVCHAGMGFNFGQCDMMKTTNSGVMEIWQFWEKRKG